MQESESSMCRHRDSFMRSGIRNLALVVVQGLVVGAGAAAVLFVAVISGNLV